MTSHFYNGAQNCFLKFCQLWRVIAAQELYFRKKLAVFIRSKFF